MTLRATRRVRVRKVDVLRLKVMSPFNFRLTTWKPSHFPSGLDTHSWAITRRSFRLGNSFVVAEMSMDKDVLVASVYANGHWTNDLRSRLERRLQRAYGLFEDISAFTRLAVETAVTRKAARQLRG